MSITQYTSRSPRSRQRTAANAATNGRRRKGHHAIYTWRPQNTPSRPQQKAGKIHRPAPLRMLAKSRPSHSVYFDPPVTLAFRKSTRRFVVGAAPGKYPHLVPALCQRLGEAGQVLRRCDDIGIEGLVEKQDSHE